MIVYNNIFTFINEIAKTNYKHNDFHIFRYMKKITYLIDILFVDFDDVYKFC